MIIGIDLDNTVIHYDTLIGRLAAERGLIDADFRGSKQRIRDHIRALPQGDVEWQRIQALIYGSRIAGAELAEGFREFVRLCRRHRIGLKIISHKTRHSNLKESREDFHQAALGWLSQESFFSELEFSESDVFFCESRGEKLQTIAAVGCRSFVDDLIEVLNEPGFPAATEKVLYQPAAEHDEPDDRVGVRVLRSWREAPLVLGIQGN